MSRGLGRTQRAILALIAAAKASDAWTIDELCAAVYGDETPTRSQLGSIGRALKRMRLPGAWRTGRAWPGPVWLYDASALAADPWHRAPIAEIELVDLETLRIELP